MSQLGAAPSVERAAPRPWRAELFVSQTLAFLVLEEAVRASSVYPQKVTCQVVSAAPELRLVVSRPRACLRVGRGKVWR